MWRLPASVSESCLNSLVLQMSPHGCITDDDYGKRSAQRTHASTCIVLETNKCARCGVPAEHCSNVRAFLSTSHVHTAGRSVRSYTHKRARLLRTARAGLDRSHPLLGHTPR